MRNEREKLVKELAKEVAHRLKTYSTREVERPF
jgi:hypothetical protein